MALEDDLPTADFEAMAATCHTTATLATCACVGQAVNGVPACADGEVMNSLMRQTWNFTGSIVSDVRNTTINSTRDFRI